MNELSAVLRSAGQNPVMLRDKVLVSPLGGRVLGLYPAPDVNVLWVNPKLESEATAAGFLADPGWVNMGGHRSWISPEIETNVGDAGRFWDTYEVPKAMDPADFHVVTAGDDAVTFETNMDLAFKHHACDVRLKVARTVALCETPPVDLPAGVSFAGYRLDSVLSAAAELPAGVRPGLWNLIQVPGGGEMVVPVNEGADPRACIAEPIFTQEGGLIRCRVKTDTSFKFSLRANDCRGFFACLNLAAATPTLLACRFCVLDQSLYAESPCDDLSDTGHAEQFYVDDGTFGGFGELEYHTPALERGARDSVSDRGEVWAFAGPAGNLKDLLDALLAQI